MVLVRSMQSSANRGGQAGEMVTTLSTTRAKRDRISISQLLRVGDDVRIQNPTLQQTTGRNPRWYIRPYVPIQTPDGRPENRIPRLAESRVKSCSFQILVQSQNVDL